MTRPRDRSFRKPMVWIMGLASVVFVALDVWAAATRAKGDTISEITLKASMDYHAIPFAYGVLSGHFFWPGQRLEGGWYWFSFAVLLGMCGFMVALPDFARWLFRMPVIAMAVGIVLGHFMWPQWRVVESLNA